MDDELGPELPAGALARRDVLPLRPDGVVLADDRVRLRPATTADAPELHAISNGDPVTRLGRSVGSYDPDALVWRYMPVGPFPTVADFASFLEALTSRPDTRTFVVEDAATGELLGSTSLVANVPAHLKVEIGAVWYSPAVQGAGVNVGVCHLLLAHAFGLGYQRVEWKCHAANTRSRAAALRIGMRFEGVQDAHSVQKGRRRDTAWFRVLREEWDATG